MALQDLEAKIKTILDQAAKELDDEHWLMFVDTVEDHIDEINDGTGKHG